MSPLPRRMLGSAASWENPQVHPLPLPEVLTYVVLAVAIRLFGGFPHQILNSPDALINAIYVGGLLIGLTVVDELRKVLEIVLNVFPPPSRIGVTIL